MVRIHHRYAVVNGYQIFYREAGPRDRPTVLLLHGFPSSSLMFRHLLPRLADRWHLVAPDHVGFGLSDAPTADTFTYSFDSLTDITATLLRQLGIERYCLFVHDHGAPIGWRLALRTPAAVTAIITQNGNAYDEGLLPEFFTAVRDYWREQIPRTEAGVREALTLELTRWRYLAGVTDETLVDPTTWTHDHDLLSRPDNDRAQLALFRDYATNLALYPQVQRYFRERQVPLLAIWGRGDPIFGPAGALAFTTDLPNAEVHLIDGGHFLLESALDEVAPLVRAFLDRHL
ncbi:pimeloyl-ACP methyl ester carboxylesterase [Streptomyces sp. 3330]|uniref:alpha/beta fold hydrolase n=1 Tax=Streptomyces sp. 3330 TaxID=2817755 RepID=UPI00285A5766|nr:alpha/beta hydrolase [Streptomyces sp. 3330]MDR6981347.1 pimeloyl-ACP methyl ester carboxylesterase [Streptomyces sp. 3330]